MLLFLKKIKNSFLTPRIYNFVVNENFYKRYDKSYKKNNLIKKNFFKNILLLSQFTRYL